MSSSIYFNGQIVVLPSAIAKIDITGMAKVTLPAGSVGAIVGPGLAGPVNEVQWFTSVQAAKNSLYKECVKTTSNPLWTAFNAAFNGSADPNIGSPGLVAGIRISGGVTMAKATGLIREAGPGATCITLTAKEYGTWGNSITFKVAGAYTVTIYDPNDSNIIEIFTGATVAALVTAINAGSNLVTAVAGAGTAPAYPTTAAAMTGGSEGTPTSTEWQTALDLLKAQNIDLLHVTSTDAAIHTLAASHCSGMSTLGKRNRRCIVGGAKTENTTAIVARATVQNSAYLMLAAPAAQMYDDSGVLTQYDCNVTAAMIFGAACGVEPNMPLTYKLINAKGLEYNYNDDEMTTLQNGKVCAVQFVTGKGYRIGKQLMTTTVEEYSELSIVRIYDYISKGLTGLMEDKFVGQPGDNNKPGAMMSSLTSFLDQVRTRGYIHDGVDSSGVFQPAYRNIDIQGSGDTWTIELEISPTEPINYIPIVIHATRTDLVL